MTDQLASEVGQVALIYDDYRTILLNKKYYGMQLEAFRRYNVVMEFLIAAGATGSGIAGLAVWQLSGGRVVWATISGVAIALSIAKPLLKLADRIEVYAKLYGEYASAFQSLKALIGEIQIYQNVSDERFRTFIQIRNKTNELEKLGDANPKHGVVRQLQRDVNAEVPVERLWFPGAEEDAESLAARRRRK